MDMRHTDARCGTRRLMMRHEPALAMAYTTSLRGSVTPTLTAQGHFATSQRMYVDSKALMAQLKVHYHGPNVTSPSDASTLSHRVVLRPHRCSLVSSRCTQQALASSMW